MTREEFAHLIRRLVAMREAEWMELKHNNADPNEIGRNLAAISNGAALHGKPLGYVLWGVDDGTHDVVGTRFRPHEAKKGNEELESWLTRLLEPRIDFRIHQGDVDGAAVVLLEVPAARHMPTRFAGREYVRIGSYTKPLADYPEKERALWNLFNRLPFEEGVAIENVDSDAVLSVIDYPEYFRLMERPLPDNRAAILQSLIAEQLILDHGTGRYDVTNVGAILFARDIEDIPRLARKALRVIIYHGDDRSMTVKEQTGRMGYAVGFERAVAYVNDQLPQNEEVGQALRREVRLYPEIAIRELVANALIHQDFLIAGAGPTVEMFPARIEITNPGVPLIEPLRFIDQPPRSRNEKLASLMRRMKICEERGSGIDKVIVSIELHQLPPPDFRTPGENTVATLFAPRRSSEMDREERIRACYQHACLRYVSGKRMTNASLRERLGLKSTNYPQASRIIHEATEAGLVKPYGGGSKRDASYLPFWA